MDYWVDYDNDQLAVTRYDHFEPAMKRASAVYFPPITLEARRGSPLYRQLYDWFQQAILSGQLRPGQRVPSTRSLAADLGISRAPVLGAFEQLHAEGYLQTTVGAGTRIAASIPQDAANPASERASGMGRRKGPRRLARTTAALIPEHAEPWFDHMGAFRVSLPALDHFPTSTWSSLLARHSRNPTLETMAYGDPMGYAPFRVVIAEYLRSVRAVRCEPEQIMIVSGSQHGLQVAARALLDPRDAVWMEDPGYPGARQVFMTAGADLVPVPVDREGLDVEEGMRRRGDARAVYITPSHQYPMGHTLSVTRRMQLLNWAARSGAWIFEDDYDSEYRFTGRPIASLQGLDADARVIYFGTFSKVLFPALRLGYVVIPRDLIPAFRAAREAIDIFSPSLVQAALTDFFKEGHFARHIRRMRMLYMERRKTLTDAIVKQLRTKLEIVGAEAGMHLLALLPPGTADVAIASRLARMRISAIPLSSCHLRRASRGGLILGYSNTDTQQIQDGVQRLAQALRSARPQR